jgi:hypothetical protein
VSLGGSRKVYSILNRPPLARAMSSPVILVGSFGGPNAYGRRPTPWNACTGWIDPDGHRHRSRHPHVSSIKGDPVRLHTHGVRPQDVDPGPVHLYLGYAVAAVVRHPHVGSIECKAEWIGSQAKPAAAATARIAHGHAAVEVSHPHGRSIKSDPVRAGALG